MTYLLSLLQLLMAIGSFFVASIFVYAHAYMVAGIAMAIVGMALTFAAALCWAGIKS